MSNGVISVKTGKVAVLWGSRRSIRSMAHIALDMSAIIVISVAFRKPRYDKTMARSSQWYSASLKRRVRTRRELHRLPAGSVSRSKLPVERDVT